MAIYMKIYSLKGFDIYFVSQGKPVNSVVPNEFAMHDFKTEELVCRGLLLIQTQCVFMHVFSYGCLHSSSKITDIERTKARYNYIKSAAWLVKLQAKLL